MPCTGKRDSALWEELFMLGGSPFATALQQDPLGWSFFGMALALIVANLANTGLLLWRRKQ